MSPNINSRLSLSWCTPPELIHMFARLAASHSSRTSPTKDDAVNDTISELNNCLNFKGKGNESPVRVLDAALSLLHFKTPQVYDTTAGFTVETIVELLSSLVACRVFNLNKEEALLVGSLMPLFDCVQLAEACNGVIGALEKRGMVSETQKIVYGVARMSVSAPCYWHTPPSVVACDMRSVSVKTKVSTKRLHCLQQDTNDLPLRLMWWYLDPLLLKHDVLEILEDALRRPFLCLNKAFHERMDWQSVIRCLALSPIMFIEIRRLLHCWFLETGLDIVHELLRDLISVILDLVSTPTCWGLITEVGLKLPFSTAYFPSNPSLLRILTGHLSSKGVKNIVCEIHKHAHDGHILDPLLEQAEKNIARVNDESSWAMAMNFPEWFYYSCAMLFGGNKFKDNHMSDCASRTLDTNQSSDDKAPSYFAAKYIAWILSPVNQSHQLALCDFLLNLSESWVLKQVVMDGIHKDSSGCRKKLKMHKQVDEKDVECSSVMSCLYKFQKLSGGTLHWPLPGQRTSLDDHQKNLLYRRIPLGILIGNHNGLNDEECELIMHYANTGTVLLQHKTHNAQLNYKKHNAEHVEDFIFVLGRDEAITGANLAFRLTELIEKISSSVFETEEITVKFTYQVKVRIGKYLLKCIKILLEHSFDNGCVTHIMDIRNRLIHWRQQGPELHVIGEDLDSVLSDLNCLMNCC